MVQKRTCDYSGQEIEPGTGTMLVKKNGTVLWFADAKCEKNYRMGREARELEWVGDDRDDVEEEAETEAADEDEADADAEDADEDESEEDAEAESDAEDAASEDDAEAEADDEIDDDEEAEA